MINKVWIIEKQELALILSYRGCKRYQGLSLCVEEKRHEAEVIERMYRKGWFENDGSHFLVKSELTEIVDQISFPEHVFFCYPPEKPKSLFCIYQGRKLLVMQESSVRRDSLMIRFPDTEECKELLEAAGIVMRASEAFTAACPDEKDIIFPKLLKRREGIREYPWILFWIEKRNGVTGTLEEQIAVWREGLHDFLVRRDAVSDILNIVPFTEGAVQRIWEEQQ